MISIDEITARLDPRLDYVVQARIRLAEATATLENAETREARENAEMAVRNREIVLAGAKDLFFADLHDVLELMVLERLQREAGPEVSRA